MIACASNPVLPMVKEVRETRDMAKVAAMLSTGIWVAIAATAEKDGTYLFSLGRVTGDPGATA